jgi:flagellar M-ring protein FliF
MAALADGEAMPAHFGTLLANATTKPGPFTSRSQIDAMNKVALERTLANTIRWMKGIKWAAVIYHLPKKAGFRSDGQPTAMVTVAPHGDKELDEHQVPKIRDLVAAAIGIGAEAVTVVDINGRSYAGGKPDGIGSSVLDDPYFSRKRSYEAECEQKIRKALSYVPGVTVTAHVELDQQLHRREEKNGWSQDRMVTEFASLTPKKVTIAVGVPDTYYEEIWRKSNPAPNSPLHAMSDKKALDRIELAEKSKIQDFVAQLIPQPDVTADVRPLVTVTTFAQLTTPELSAPATTDRVFEWISTHRSILGTIGIGLASLVLLRSMVGSPWAASPAPAVALPPSTDDIRTKTAAARKLPLSEKKPEKTTVHPLKYKPKDGESLREELVAMVRDDPDSAADVLRRWIGRAP